MISRYRNILALLLAVVVFSTCKKKDPKDIGLPLLPGEDLLSGLFTDTLTIITHTVKEDSLITDEVSPMLLGTMHDPVFGITRSSIVTQFIPATANPDFGKNPIIDSAVISLMVYNKQSYGNIKTPQKFEVYELTEDLSVDSTYFSNKTPKYNPAPVLGTATFIPKVKDSVKVYTVKYPAHVRVKLNASLFQKFLTDPAYKNTYDSISEFRKKFKGVYIKSTATPAQGEGGLVYIAPTGTYSRLTIFYKNDSLDSLYYSFPIVRNYTSQYSQFEHDYTTATAITQQLNSSPAIQQDRVYVQPMGGLKTKITFPDLLTIFGGKKVAINKAELIIPIDPSTIPLIDSSYSNSVTLGLTMVDSLRKSSTILPIDLFEGLPYFGGQYDVVKKEYRFNIARYVQNVLKGNTTNQGLYILSALVAPQFPYTRSLLANRTILMGGDKNNVRRIRLKITYTPIN